MLPPPLPPEDGVLYTFGSDYWGCIGCNNQLDEEVTQPYKVEFFADNPVELVACGDCHLVVVTGKEKMFLGCLKYLFVLMFLGYSGFLLS